MPLSIKKNLNTKSKFHYSLVLSCLGLNLIVSLASCRHYGVHGELMKTNPTQIIVPYFDSIQYEYHYTAKIRAYDKEINGILVVKKIDRLHKRVVMLSDFGNTIFNFEYKNDKARVIYVMDNLNKKIIVDRLLLYFDFLSRSCYQSSRYIVDGELKTYISRIRNKRVKILQKREKFESMSLVSRWKEKAEVRYYANTNYADSIVFQSRELFINMFFVKRDKVFTEDQ
jgi:hypothetical protein